MIFPRIFRFSKQIFQLLIANLMYIFATLSSRKKVIVRFAKIKNGNFGDDLNYYIINNIVTKKIILLREPSLKRLYFGRYKPYLLFIGSIIGSDINNSIILGAGIMSQDTILFGKPLRILSVRGPQTKLKLEQNGLICNNIFGDPALILPKLKIFHRNIKYQFGFIPHYIDKNNKYSRKIINEFGFYFIDIQNDVKSVLKDILSCKYIISSSLHGIITADAYGIQSRWIKLSNKVNGEGFKFRDYYKSTGRLNNIPYIMTAQSNKKDLISLFDKKESFEFDIDNYYNFIVQNINKIIDEFY